MAFLPKNEFWKARSKHGPDHLFSSPQALWEGALEYLDWNEKNPLYALESVKYMGECRFEPVPRLRIATLMGLCQFLGIAHRTWYNYREREEFTPTCEEIEKLLDRQKLEGASADLCNPSIVARLMGLTDKQEHTQYVSGPGGKPIQKEWKITIVDPSDDKDED